MRDVLNGHDHPLPRLPGIGNVLLRTVGRESLINLVRQPQQGKLPQCSQIAHPKIIIQRWGNARFFIDLAITQAGAQELRGYIHQLDLIRRTHHLVWHRLLRGNTGDLLYYVIEAFKVLDVQGRNHIDSCG